MNTILILLFFLMVYLLTLCYAQTITLGSNNEIVLYESYTASSITLPASAASANCVFLKTLSDGFCSVTFITSGSKISFSNLKVGRSRGYNCSNSAGYILQGVIIVRSNIKAFVCDTVKTTHLGDMVVMVNVVVTLSQSLPSPGSIACEIEGKTQPTVSAPVNAISINIPVNYTKTSSGVNKLNCNFTWNDITSSFSANILAETQQISIFPAKLTTSESKFQVNLNSNFKPVTDLTVICSVHEFNPAINCTGKSSVDVSKWEVTSPITIKAGSGDISKVLYISNPTLSDSDPAVQPLSLICCVTNRTLEATSAITYNRPTKFSSVAEDVVYNATTKQVTIELKGYSSETSYPDIKYFPLSKCPCDLTVDVCDLNCCCDGFCNCTSSASTAIAGPFGGNSLTQAISNQHNCSTLDSKTITMYPYLSLLCLEYESSSIIGDYWVNDNITSDPILIGQKLANGRQLNPSFEFVTTTSSSASSSSSTSSSALSSSPVQTIAASTTVFSNLPSTGILTLPGKLYKKPQCNPQSPIYLFQDSVSNCDVSVTTSSCAATGTTIPQIDPWFYLVSSTALSRSCPDQLAIKSIGAAGTATIPIFTFYQCDTSVSCTFNNGFEIPQLVINGSSCNNAVKSVRYRIFLNSSDIVFVESTVTLTSVPIDSSTLAQTFTVNFVSKSLAITNSPTTSLSYNQLLNLYSDMLSTSSSSASSFRLSYSVKSPPDQALAPGALPATSKKSGLYGYDVGKPIITVEDTTAATPKFQNIKLIPLDQAIKCPASTVDVNTFPDSLFGISSVNYCLYELTDDDFKDCTVLNTKLKTYLNQFAPYENVAIYGNPEDSTDYVKITNTAITEKSNKTLDGSKDTNAPINKIEGVCTNVIISSVITIYYSRQGRARNQFILNIRGVKRDYVQSNIFKSTPDSSKGLKSKVLLSTKVNYEMIAASNIPDSVSTSTKSSEVCQFDICINDLLYPWNYDYEGKMGLYEQAYGIVLLGFSVFLLIVTFPWW